jgi:hypothetical protein
MIDTPRLRLRRKPSRPIVDTRAPEVARKRSADARTRIEDGLNALRRVRSVAEIGTLEGLKLISIEGFRRWKGLGNDTLYKTNADLLPKLKTQLDRVAALGPPQGVTRKSGKKRWSETASLRARVQELEHLLAARNKDCIDLMLLLESARKELRDGQKTQMVGSE